MLLLTVVLVPETYPPTLLRRKALLLQQQSDAACSTRSTSPESDLDEKIPDKSNLIGPQYIAKYDQVKRTRWEIVKVGMTRPFEMMFKEWIVISLGLYGKSCVSRDPSSDRLRV